MNVATQRRITLVMPVFNDWAAVSRLVEDIDTIPELSGFVFDIVAVDDGSTQPARPDIGWEIARVRSFEVVELACNVGHQRAIAIGLVAAAENRDCHSIVVMDADGEDRPKDIRTLHETSMAHPEALVCAKRGKRTETLRFRISYGLYKALFRLLTGAAIDFGNFCLIPANKLTSLVHNASIWNNLAASIIRSRLPVERIALDRGSRYAGRSQMNLVSLVMHGMSAISVYSDIVLVRLLFFLLVSTVIIGVGVVVTIAVRFLTELAIPGWATTVVGLLCVILFQSIFFSLIAVFTLLNNRTTKTIIPVQEAPTYILRRTDVLPKRDVATLALHS